MNSVKFKGVIVHKFETEKAVLLTISTRDAGPVVNYPAVVFLKDTKEQTREFEQYDHVTITGNVQSSVRKDSSGKAFTKQSIFGETIERTPKTLEKEFGVEGAGKYPIGENSFSIEGEIVFIIASGENVVTLKVRTNKNNHISYVKVFYYTKKAKEVAAKLKKGDIICGIGSIQTRKKEAKEGSTLHYENVVLHELSQK